MRSGYWLVLVALGISACGPRDSEIDSAGPQASMGESDLGFVEDTREQLRRLEKLGFAGVVVVTRDGEPVLVEGLGLADRESGVEWGPDTVSTIGSITKQFTGAAILLLAEEGKLSPGDPITDYFEDVPDDKRDITLHQLLTHSSGIVDLDGLDDWDPIDRQEFVQKAMDQPLAFAPGESYTYSNAGYSLLGAIIEQLTGDSYERCVHDRLFVPNGMSQTGYILADWSEGSLANGYIGDELWGTVLGRPIAEDGPYWVLRANGGIHSTANDMLRWAEALTDGGVLSEQSMAQYWAPHVDEGYGDSHYAYGWVVLEGPADSRVITHNGGNGILFADMAIVPEQDLVLFMQTNVAAELPVVEEMLEAMLWRWLDGEPYPAIPDVVAVSESELVSLAGEYQLGGDGGGGILQLRALDGELIVSALGQVAFGLLHSSRKYAPDRADRLSTRIEEIVAAYVQGNFEPLHRAYGERTTLERLKTRGQRQMAAYEEQYGPFKEFDILGTAMRGGRDVTLVRYTFERGHSFTAYVWDPDAEENLRGRSVRGMASEVRFIPTGPDTFGSWDGGISPSRELRIETQPDGARALRLAVSDGTITATADD